LVGLGAAQHCPRLKAAAGHVPSVSFSRLYKWSHPFLIYSKSD
jgi:hypothetical protein